ncbi:nucleoside hydrolase [Allofustis seminis]|uniref:nucleoside hydrolase n=1 Tax=Allofustis seminis TaxID=166939 RepID=UPI000364E4A9|nr:nucleoside hydrolase [Allofustis seminis]
MKRKIIIDCDPGVDDALAILLALNHPEIEVEALCSVTGNGLIEHTTANALKILKLCGREDIPVYRGCNESLSQEVPETVDAFGDDGLGGYAHLVETTQQPEQEHAVDFLVRYAREHSGEFTLFIIGPCTNIAQALRKDPEFVHHVKEVLIMGGTKGFGNASPVAEYNFWADAQAAQEVLAAGFKKVTMIGLNVTHPIALEADIREMLRIFATDLSTFIYKITQVGVDEAWQSAGRLVAPMHDVLTVAYFIDPTLLEVIPAHIDVVTEGIAEGESVVDLYGKYHQGQCNAHYAATVDVARFNELFLTTVFPEFKDEIIQYIKENK